jgi:hypothetical protein
MNYQVADSFYGVTFSKKSQIIETLEGNVACSAGDAIVTGSKGETWPVTREAFFRKYVPMRGLLAGDDGQYTKRLAFVQVRQLDREETIELSDGRGTVTGQTGDWCLTYGIGNQAFIRSDIFSETYEPCKSVSVTVSVESALLGDEIGDLLDAEAALRSALPHTPLIFTSLNADDACGALPWFSLARAKPSSGGNTADSPTVLSLKDVASRLGNRSLLDQIRLLQNRTAFSFTWDRFRGLLFSFYSEVSEDADTELIAAQLVAMDELNAELQKGRTNEFFIGAVPETLSTAANDDLRRVGAVADLLAVESQRKWQQLVLADTKAIASLQNKSWFAKPFAMAWLLLGNSIVTLGMLAALGLAGFSELAEGCETGDWFAWTGCSTEGWKHWVGFGAFALYIGALVVAWWRFALAKVHRYEGKHQDYRLLAECLRVQYVLSAMGVTQCVADDFSAGRQAESSWVLLALHALAQQGKKLGREADAGQGRDSDSSAWAMIAFVKEQARYHETTLIKRREHAIKALSTIGRWGAALFLVCLVLLIVNVMSKLLNQEAAVFGPMGQHVLLILQVAGLALWGSMRKVMDTFALEQEFQRGQIVLDALQRANASDKQSIIHAAKLFAQDQSAWHALRRSKPVEATTGGG